jgi:hypothetical protein
VTGANSMNTISGSGTVNIVGTSGSATTDVLTLNGPNSYTAATVVGDATTADVDQDLEERQARDLQRGVPCAARGGFPAWLAASGVRPGERRVRAGHDQA